LCSSLHARIRTRHGLLRRPTTTDADLPTACVRLDVIVAAGAVTVLLGVASVAIICYCHCCMHGARRRRSADRAETPTAGGSMLRGRCVPPPHPPPTSQPTCKAIVTSLSSGRLVVGVSRCQDSSACESQGAPSGSAGLVGRDWVTCTGATTMQLMSQTLCHFCCSPSPPFEHRLIQVQEQAKSSPPLGAADREQQPHRCDVCKRLRRWPLELRRAASRLPHPVAIPAPPVF
jgi:hypothetical protein